MYLSMQHRLLPSLARPCRTVARRRYPASVGSGNRGFRPSRPVAFSTPRDPRSAADSAPVNTSNDSSKVDEGKPREDGIAPGTTVVPGQPSAKKDPGPYGSGVRRALRNRQPAKDWTLPAATVPSWFYERNTIVRDAEQSPGSEILRQIRIESIELKPNGEPNETESLASGGDGADRPTPSSSSLDSESRYAVEDAVWDELVASVKAGLKLPPAKYANEPSALNAHLVLQYPGNDGILFLDTSVRRLSREIGADLVTLNAQDIAELCSEQDLADSGMTSPIRFLGYEVYRPSSSSPWQDLDEEISEGGDEDDADLLDPSSSSRTARPGIMQPRFITIESSREPGDIPVPGWLGLKSLVATLNGPMPPPKTEPGSAGSLEHRWLRLINALISPMNRESGASTTESSESHVVGGSESPLPTNTRDLIIQIQDYKEIQRTREGLKFLSLLQQAILTRRKAGARVLLVGTVAGDVHASSQYASRIHSAGVEDQFSKTLLITPTLDAQVAEDTFLEDRKRRTMEVNIRHLQDMLQNRLGDDASVTERAILSSRDWSLSASIIEQSGLNDHYWTYSQIHRLATLALGSMKKDETFGLRHIEQGIELMGKTDQVRSQWLKDKSSNANAAGQVGANKNRDKLLKSLRPTCNTHEKKLLNGVVDATSIRTTFADVHVPPETIEALKTLTTLSLIRPEAFSYGVLATDKIPGLLLYGPPGTGKTLLAKAVARESGATVLEVSGSEVYDMYVGEGEKNVKAIFTLAKKLSPCVVFIDEADAIFCSRTGASSRTSHRELINQFLREWDGMNDMSAFIMVATNRPFDLDDAVLRRLPRRLLVDLPTEQDRLAILKIHLKDEILDPSVDLAELARRTPLYSGSDLKNLSVAAALACVREENAWAAQHQGTEPYQYPARRILTRSHFERGMEEISASISEDMSSLSAIRKFDEQYGDRKGRRKKSPAWGFNPVGVDKSVADTARVRT